MKLQNFQQKDLEIRKKFIEYRRKKDVKNLRRLNLSWQIGVFGVEELEKSIARIAKNNIGYVELKADKYTKDIGKDSKEILKVLDHYGVKASGVCGIETPESEFAGNSPFVRQRCIDYFRRSIDLCKGVGGTYMLFIPGAVGRPIKYDNNEFLRAAEAVNSVGDHFLENGVRGAIEPVRPEEVSLCHTLAEAKKFIDAVNHPGVKNIGGDVFHMITGEEHISSSILKYGSMIVDLHIADTNRRALGSGFLDLDLILMALYMSGYNNENCFFTPEPLGTGGDPYSALYSTYDTKELDDLVEKTASYFYERQEEVLNASDSEIINV